MAESRRGRRGRPVFEWDRGNEEKLLERHNVSALEAEQCFTNPHSIRGVGEAYLFLGRTDDGRMLLLVYQQNSKGAVRVYSGREMTEKERRAYRRSVR